MENQNNDSIPDKLPKVHQAEGKVQKNNNNLPISMTPTTDSVVKYQVR